MNVAHKLIDTSTDFGGRLASERKRLGLQMHELAHLAGVTDYMQKRLENGTSAITIDYIYALALRSDVNISYLITGAALHND